MAELPERITVSKAEKPSWRNLATIAAMGRVGPGKVFPSDSRDWSASSRPVGIAYGGRLEACHHCMFRIRGKWMWYIRWVEYKKDSEDTVYTYEGDGVSGCKGKDVSARD